MASVFLSYDHEDAGRATPIAEALEKAGHSVWWDRQIHGGAEYNKAIESAVEQSDAVVVLWSERSVKSAWVRDEAAEGRDHAKLVPVTLDGTKPPMGFRQYQTIPLAEWRGRKPHTQLGELLHAIDKVVGSVRARKSPIPSGFAQGRWRTIPVALAASGAAVVALLAIGILAWKPFAARASASVAVAAVDSSRASQELARDLLAQLGQLQSAKPDSLQLVGPDVRKRASLVFQVAGAAEGRQTRANLVLLDGSTGGLLWSKAFERPAQEVGDLRQELGYTAAQVLECAVEAHPGGRAALEPEPLKLYLNGCAELAGTNYADISALIPVFRRVIAATPQFEGAWDKLLVAEDEAYAAGYYSGVGSHQAADIKRDIEAARKIFPDLAAAYLAEINLLPLNAFSQKLSLVERAIVSDPDSPLPLSVRSDIRFSIGRVSDALDDSRRAAEIDPISPRTRQDYIVALAEAGRTQAALEELAKAERIWPGSSGLVGTRFAIHLRFGDPRVAWKIIQSGQVGANWIGARNFLQARLNPTAANVSSAIKDARAFYSSDHTNFQHLVQTMSILNREDELLPLLMSVPMEDAGYVTDVTFRPAARDLWRNPKSLEFAKRVGLLQYWQSSGKWPDFCYDTDLPYDCKKEAAKLTARSPPRML
jgi:tetratricopeptide (TPR) repeat protein